MKRQLNTVSAVYTNTVTIAFWFPYSHVWIKIVGDGRKRESHELRHSNCKEEKKQCRGCLLLLRCRKLRLHTLLGNAVPEVRGCKTLRSALSPPPSSGGLSRNPTPVFLIYLVKPPLLSEMNSRWNPGLSEVSELIPGNCVEQSDTVYAAHPHCNFSPFIFSTIKM